MTFKAKKRYVMGRLRDGASSRPTAAPLARCRRRTAGPPDRRCAPPSSMAAPEPEPEPAPAPAPWLPHEERLDEDALLAPQQLTKMSIAIDGMRAPVTIWAGAFAGSPLAGPGSASGSGTAPEVRMFDLPCMANAHSPAHDGTGSSIWPGCQMLVQYLLSCRSDWARSLGSLCELGSGTGLLGLALAAHMQKQATVVLTDGSVPVLHVLRANAELASGNCGAQVCARALTFGRADEIAGAIDALRPGTVAPRRFSCVVCSEVMYRSATLVPLLATIDELLDERAGSTAFLCFKQRGQARRSKSETEQHVAETLRVVLSTSGDAASGGLRLRWIDVGEEGPAAHRSRWKEALAGDAEKVYDDMSLCACERI
jgi:hypothetical protein